MFGFFRLFLDLRVCVREFGFVYLCVVSLSMFKDDDDEDDDGVVDDLVVGWLVD